MSDIKTTTVRLTGADQRNAKAIIKQGYAANLSGAIRTALAHLAQRNGR